MSEPTKEQIEEARELFLSFEVSNKNHAYAVAKVIALVRAKATNDALERAIVVGREWVGLAHQVEEFEAAIRAMKVPL